MKVFFSKVNIFSTNGAGGCRAQSRNKPFFNTIDAKIVFAFFQPNQWFRIQTYRTFFDQIERLFNRTTTA